MMLHDHRARTDFQQLRLTNVTGPCQQRHTAGKRVITAQAEGDLAGAIDTRLR